MDRFIAVDDEEANLEIQDIEDIEDIALPKKDTKDSMFVKPKKPKKADVVVIEEEFVEPVKEAEPVQPEPEPEPEVKVKKKRGRKVILPDFIKCDCGEEVDKRGMAMHKRTDKHLRSLGLTTFKEINKSVKAVATSAPTTSAPSGLEYEKFHEYMEKYESHKEKKKREREEIRREEREKLMNEMKIEEEVKVKTTQNVKQVLEVPKIEDPFGEYSRYF